LGGFKHPLIADFCPFRDMSRQFMSKVLSVRPKKTKVRQPIVLLTFIPVMDDF
jgi:hypothetical protein